MENLPTGWARVKLGECVHILDAKRIPVNNDERKARIENKSQHELYPYYGATGQAGWIDDYIFDEELVALGEDGVPFFDPRKDKAYKLTGKTWVNNHAHVLKAIDKYTLNEFILHYLNSFDYHGYVNGATRLKLTQANMRKIPIPLPPLTEQHQIAALLDKHLSSIDAIKSQLNAILPIIKTFRQSVLADAVSGKLTEDWRAQNNQYSAKLDYDNLLKNEDKKDKTTKEKTKLRLNEKFINKSSSIESWICLPFFEFALLNRGFDLPTNQRKDGEFPVLSSSGHHGFHNEFSVKAPCVTVGRSGSVGKVFFSGVDSWALNTTLYVKSFGFSDPKYVYWKLKSLDLAQYSASTAVPTLNRNEFMFEMLEIPPLAEQRQIVATVERLFAQADTVEQHIHHALAQVNDMTQSVLHQAFTGQLTAHLRGE